MHKAFRLLFVLGCALLFPNTSRAQRAPDFSFACRILMRAPQSAQRFLDVGSCFYVRAGKHNFVITNEHVGHPGGRMVNEGFFALFNKREEVLIPIHLRAFQRLSDVAIFEVSDGYESELPHSAEFGDFHNLRVGSRLSVVVHAVSNFSPLFDVIQASVVNTDATVDNAFRPSRLKIQAMLLPGMSGGPVLDTYGRVIGMVSGSLGSPILISGPGSDSLYGEYHTEYSYAIPSDDILRLIQRTEGLPEGNEYNLPPGGLGVRVGICRYHVPGCGPTPIIFYDVLDSALTREGLRSGDVLDAVNDTPVRTGADFARELFLHRTPGERVELLIWRELSEGNFFQVRIVITLGDGSEAMRDR